MARSTKRKRRTRAEVEEIRRAAWEELAEHHPMTLRQVHYRLVARGDTTYTNTHNDYKALSRWLVEDRLSGRVPWEWIEDRMRRPRQAVMWPSLPSFLRSVRRSYRRDVWSDQPEYLEVVVEKDALSGIFEEVLNPYGVTLNVGRGYDSWSALKEASDRIGSGEGATVLYFGDFDPSGEDMVRSLRERLADTDLPSGGSFPEIVKCALVPEDIELYELPPDFTKTTDSRRAAFVEQHGDVSVELDALPLDVLRGRIRDAVEARMDLNALERTRQLEQQDRERLNDLLDG
ncbi:MAG: hypothetical protein M3R38_25935 [Actinomycetota bacterium]|nr:hypothetical protein [Actinomycetota bacterium]